MSELGQANMDKQSVDHPFVVQPYYEKDGITIYNTDCKKVLPWLGGFDLLLTDPPYGIGEDGGKFRDRKGGGHRVLPKMDWDSDRPEPYLLQLAVSCAADCIIWGGNYFADLLPASRGWLYWDKKMGGDFSDGELAYTSIDSVLKAYSFCNKGVGKVHPTQKPLELIQWCLSRIPETKTVIDPFMGSGTTLVAAKLAGIQAVGIEINERYCEAAVKRLAQGVLPFE